MPGVGLAAQQRVGVAQELGGGRKEGLPSRAQRADGPPRRFQDDLSCCGAAFVEMQGTALPQRSGLIKNQQLSVHHQVKFVMRGAEVAKVAQNGGQLDACGRAALGFGLHQQVFGGQQLSQRK